MKKIFTLISITLIGISMNAQTWTVTSSKFTKTEGGSAGFINVKYSSPAHNMVMTTNYTITGKNAGATSADYSVINHTSGTISFAAMDSTEQLNFSAIVDNTAEGNDTFIFRISSPSMGTIGSQDSCMFIIRDSTVVPVTPPGTRSLVSIGTVIGANTGNIPAYKDSFVRIRGTIYGENVQFYKFVNKGGYRYSISDGTGAIGIYSASLNFPQYDTVGKSGDTVEVSGKIEQFNGLTQLNFGGGVSGDTIIKLGTHALPAIMAVSTLNETTESKLVKISNLHMVSGTWKDTSSFELIMNDGNKDFKFFINNFKNFFSSAALALIKSGKLYTITGIGGQFCKSAGLDTGYQLLPRNGADIVETGTYNSIINGNTSADISIYPNPSNGQNLTINIDGFNSKEMVTIYVIDIQGRTITHQSKLLNSGNNELTIETANIENGIYNLMISSANLKYSRPIAISK